MLKHDTGMQKEPQTQKKKLSLMNRLAFRPTVSMIIAMREGSYRWFRKTSKQTNQKITKGF